MNLAGALRWVRVRRRTYALLEGGTGEDRFSHLLHSGIVVLILISVATVILESVPTLSERYHLWFLVIEIIAAVAFSLEYALRLWSAVEHPPLHGQAPWQARWRFIRQPSMIVDLLAIIPFFIAFMGGDGFQVLLIFRLIRFFKLARYSPGMRSLQEAITQERRALLACLVILCGLMIVAAAAMHMAEGTAQPDKFGSIPEAMWWAIITLTTVGYGDVVPVTIAGKLVASVTALGGLVMLALPVGIIATSFSEVIRRRDFVVTWAMVSKLPIFAGLGAESVGDVLRVMRSRMVEPGEVIVRRGTHTTSMFVVVSGSVEELLPQGHVLLNEGHFFGEAAVLGDGHCTATVRAVEPSRLLALDRHDFHALIEREPHLRHEFEAAIESRRAITSI